MRILSELKIPSGLTKRVIILSIILLPIMLSISSFNVNLTTRAWSLGGFFLSYIYLLLINELVGRIKPSWRLSIQEITVLYIPFIFATGMYYYMAGTTQTGFIFVDTAGMISAVWAKVAEPYATNWAAAIPPFWVPTDLAVTEAAYSGLRPGETLNWGAWTVPMLYWGAYYFIWIILGQLWGVLFRKPFIEDEKLPFIATTPITYATKTYYDIDPQTNKSRLFSLKQTHTKIFWIFFVGGLIGGIVPIIMEIIPALPAELAGVWGSVSFDYTPYTRDVLPGAQFAGWLDNVMWPVFIFLPFDFLAAFIIAWIVFGIIVPVVLVRTGAAPYEVGVETYTSWYFGWRPPFHYAFFAMTGMVMGIGIWTIYLARNHIVKAFNAISSLWKGKESEYYDQEIPLGKIALGIAVFSVSMLIFWIASGIPFIIALAELMLFTLFSICVARVCAEYSVFPPVGIYVTQPTLYSIGVLTGAWSSAPTTNPAAIQTFMMDAPMNGWTRAYLPGASDYILYPYKVGDSTKTRAIDIFKWTMFVTAFCVVFVVVFSVWWASHVGGLEHNTWGGGTISTAESTANVGFEAVDYNHTTHWIYMITGAITSMILYALRMRFIWMGFLNPIAWMMSMWIVEWTFPYVIPAIIVKYLVLRIGGVRALEEKTMPAITGWLVGWGLMQLFMGTRTLLVEGIPNFWSLYVP